MTTGPALCGLRTGRRGLKLEEGQSPGAIEAARVAGSVGQAVTHTRVLAHLLYPIGLELHGLASALRELASHTLKVFGIRCDFVCPGPVPRQERHIEGHLFRIAQEGVANAVRHGRARRILIELARGGAMVTCSVPQAPARVRP